LYSGLSGIGLFFGYIGQVTGEERYTRTARAVARIVVRELSAAKWPPDLPVGAFGTLAGSAYFLTHMAFLWNDTDLLIEAEKVLGAVQPAVGKDTHLDIMFGAAGCIPVLLGLNRLRPRNSLVDSALDCGDHLISRAEPAGPGIAWKTAPNSSGPLAGFSHGVAGIAWALFELHAMTSEVRFLDAAFEGLAYERSLFSVEASNWPDLRVFDGLPAAGTKRPGFMTAWCHGAAGIGIARVGMLRHSPGPDIAAEVEREVNAAVKATIAQGFSSNHCLCHGALGNIELLLAASEALADPGIGLEAYRAAAVVLDTVSETGWLCGVPAGVETPGLMVGLAGIGYEFLRLAAPATVPSVLALSSPIV
ncbi:MAG: type 2 lanthipeptide synthetase LanM, partial [Blastocatellia bacterium]